MAKKHLTREMRVMTLTLEQIFGILEEDWLYDLLPGDGQDDYILTELRRHFLFEAQDSDLEDKS